MDPIAKLITVFTIAFSLGSPVSASVVSDADSKLKIYANDGDGMTYVVSGGSRKSVAYDETVKYPLDAKGQVRYEVVENRINSIKAPAGKAGLVLTRPLTDLEVAQVHQALITVSQASAATAVAISPSADIGPVIDTFDALRDNQGCKVSFHEKAIDFCGDRLGRSAKINWTMFDGRTCQHLGYGIVQCAGEIKFNFGYETLEGRKAIAISFVNKNASDRFMQVYSSWSGSIPQRI